MKNSRYIPHIAWLALLVFAFFAHSLAPNDPGKVAALFANGVMANFVDPLIWLLAAIPAAFIRRQGFVFLGLITASLATTLFKLYLSVSTGSSWLHGSMLGNLFGFVAVGYVINAIVVFRRAKEAGI